MSGKRIIFLIICYACLCDVAGQAFLSGSVLDSETGQRLPDVNISMTDQGIGVATNAEGVFSIGPLDPGSYVVQVSFIGYSSILDSISVGPGLRRVEREYALVPDAVLAPEVFVTATRRAQSLHLAPASVAVVNSQDIRQRQIQTFDQAIEDIPGVTLVRSTGANVQSLSIRGASETAGGGIGNRVLLLIDGRPSISPESGGALWNLVPLNSLERIETVKGAYSALFGSSAMGGVIQAITRNPSDIPETRITMDLGIYDRAPDYTGYERMGSFHSLGVSHSFRKQRVGYLFDVSRKRNDGHRAKSAFHLLNTFGKITYDLDPDHKFVFSANFNSIFNDTPATWLSSQDPLRVADFRKDDYQDRQELSLDLKYTALGSPGRQYTARTYVYANRSEFLFNDDPDNDSTNVNIGKQFVSYEVVRTRRFGHISQVDASLGSAHYFIAGVDLKYDRTSGLPDTVLYGKHNVFDGGIYVQDEWSPSEEWIITAGIRYDYYSIIDEYSEGNFSPKIAAVYTPGDRWTFRALLAQAFRNPPIAERFIKFEQGGGLSFEPNPELRSERLTLSAELGTKVRLNEKVTFDAAVFYNRYRDLISFQQLPGQAFIFKVVNLNEALMQGIEISAQLSPFGFLQLNAGYTYLDARDTSSDRVDDALAYKAKHSFSFRANANIDRFQFSLSGRGRSRLDEVFIYPGSEPDGYFVTDARVQYTLSKHYDLAASVNNIGGAQYEEIERYRMPGRSYALSFSARW